MNTTCLRGVRICGRTLRFKCVKCSGKLSNNVRYILRQQCVVDNNHIVLGLCLCFCFNSKSVLENNTFPEFMNYAKHNEKELPQKEMYVFIFAGQQQSTKCGSNISKVIIIVQ
ncbi:hypothetical protein LXL04_030224 [Taraxacum kok-saghyz]